MSLIFNGIVCTTIEQLEDLIVDLSEEQKTMTRNDFNGIPNAVSQPTMLDIVNAKISQYQIAAPALLRELYVTNTLSGITTAQSDQMFDDFADVLLRLKEGAYPTALYRLNQKVPNGFVTQELIDAWKNKITSYMT